MSEENKTVELEEDVLQKVSGGGNGTIPKKGIEFASYYFISDGYYYSSQKSTIEVAYVYKGVDGGLYYTIESISCSGDNWYSSSIFGPRSIDNESDFRSRYPYILNIRP